MELPKNIKFRAVMFSSGGGSGIHEQHARNDEYGINVINLKESHEHSWVKTFTVDRFPNKVFNSGKEVIEAFKELG